MTLLNERKIGFDKIVITLNTKQNLIRISNEILRGNNIVYKKSFEGAEVALVDSNEIITIDRIRGSIGKRGADMIKLELGERGTEFLYIDINLPKLFYRTNELNLSDEDAIKEVPELVQNLLKKSGIEIDIEQCNVSSVEVNYNTYNDFYKTFKLINVAWKHHNYKVFKVERKNNIESLCLDMSRFSIKVYNKTVQFKDKNIELLTDKNCSRVEVKLKSSRTLKETFEDNNLLTVLENLDVLKNYYIAKVNKYITKQTEALSKEIEKEILNSLEKKVKPSKIFKNMMYELAIDKTISMIDVEIFENAMRKYYKKQKKANVSRDIKKQLDTLTEEQLEVLSNNLSQIRQFDEDIRK